MRAKGASRAQALRFIYGVFLSNSIIVVSGSIVAGLGFWFMTVGSLWLYSNIGVSGIWEVKEALLHGLYSPSSWILLALVVFYSIILPLTVSFRIVGVRDIARLMRGRGLG